MKSHLVKNMIISKWLTLTNSEREIASFFIEEDWSNLSISLIAKKVNKSKSLVSILVKKFGYNSFKEFKYECWKNDSSNDELQKIRNTIKNIEKFYNEKKDLYLDIKKLSNKMHEYDEIYLFGILSNAAVIEEVKRRFSKIGVKITVFTSVEIISTYYMSDEKNKLLLFISHRGDDNSMYISTMKYFLKQKNLYKILIISNDKSKLQNYCDDIYILAPNTHTENMAEISTIFSTLYFFELLFFSYINNGDFKKYNKKFEKTFKNEKKYLY